ncbi:helix-turn-helix domain-containing protein [Paenibacillaceae bacterium]|nr:helix-turn-helix domain-containing protein [Paenibacillaceae bacterium]
MDVSHSPTEGGQHYPLHYVATEYVHLAKMAEQMAITDKVAIFAFVRRGTMGVRLTQGRESGLAEAQQGEVVYIPANCSAVIENIGAGPVEAVFIRFHSERPLAVSSAEVILFQVPQLQSWVQEFLNHNADHPGGDSVHYYKLQSYLYHMAAMLMQKLHMPDHSLLSESFADIEQARRYLLDHYHESIDIEELARRSGVGQSRFYQEFKRHAGLSPHKFLTMSRLNRSLRLLADRPGSIMEVAHAVGYPDEFYFSRLFKKHMGLSPSEFAACANVRVANLSPVFQGDLSVLGIKPVLSLERGWSQQPEYYLQQIERCQPDIILASPVADHVHDALRGIAPVVMLHWKQCSWKERLLAISDALGLTSVAQHWLAYFEKKAENARHHIRQQLQDEPFLVVRVMEDESLQVFGNQRQRMKDLFYDELQLAIPDSARERSFLDTVSLEEIVALECDNIIFLVESRLPERKCRQLEGHWRQHRTSRWQGQCLFVRHSMPLLYNAAAHDALIDRTVHYFLQTDQLPRKVHV